MTHEWMLEHVGLHQVLDNWASSAPGATAVIDAGGHTSTEALRERASLLAAGLRANGVKAGDRVFARARGYADFVALAVAVARLGAVMCPVNPMLGSGEVANLVAAIRPRVCVDVTDAGEPAWLSVADLEGQGQDKTTGVSSTWSDIALIGFTGGTTGTPKGVMHNWSTAGYAVKSAALLAGLDAGDALMATLPIGSAPGFTFAIHHALRLRGALLLHPRFDAEEYLCSAVDASVRWTMAVPTQVAMIADAAEAGGTPSPWSGVRGVAVGGAPMHATEVARWERLLGAPMLRMFGLSECLGHCSWRPSDPAELRHARDGRPFPGTELEAYDADGRILPRGTRGQAGVRGPSLFLGYFEQEAMTRARMTPDGVFLTGDQLVCHEDGSVEVLGRDSDLIIRGGTNIDPKEIEEILVRMPDVATAAVVGQPDARLGEAVVAFLVLRADASAVDTVAVREHFEAQQIAKFKWPELVVVLDELPTTAMGKVHKAALAERFKSAEPASAG